MKRLLLITALLAALVVPAGAAAHPLGNFTVNRHTEIELSGGSVYVHYALDLAEIPTFQIGDRVRSPRFAGEAARSLELRIDGRRAPLRLLERRVASRPGAGGLKTLRFDAVYAATGTGTATGSRLTFVDRNFAARIGWREVVVRAEDGAELAASSVPATSESDGLRAYPTDLLRSPLDVTSATATFTLGSGPGSPPALDGTAAAVEYKRGGFEALVSRGDLSLGVILLSLAIAAFWGAAHALTPGHGKAIVAGYLVGTKGRPVDAVLLGGIVTITHTIGVFALGLVTLLLSQFIVPEALYPWLTFASGLLVVAVGASVLWSRARGRGHGHHHPHGHEHGHGHNHRHDHIDRRGLLGVGVAAGLLPCPSALVVLLSAIALHRIGFGLALILAFSVGLAATITSIGLVAVLAKRAFSRLSFDGTIVRLLPAASALVILAVGVGITLKALPEVL
ncbi:MAG TPA: sulfite exporter TauE/SafE family protein [Gaiellaceae bacterium]